MTGGNCVCPFVCGRATVALEVRGHSARLSGRLARPPGGILHWAACKSNQSGSVTTVIASRSRLSVVLLCPSAHPPPAVPYRVRALLPRPWRSSRPPSTSPSPPARRCRAFSRLGAKRRARASPRPNERRRRPQDTKNPTFPWILPEPCPRCHERLFDLCQGALFAFGSDPCERPGETHRTRSAPK